MQVARNPFARGEYRRQTYTHGSCRFCGCKPRRLHSYTWEPDGRPNRYPESNLLFCNFECFKAYHC